jgi:hypothetical protein
LPSKCVVQFGSVIGRPERAAAALVCMAD